MICTSVSSKIKTVFLSEKDKNTMMNESAERILWIRKFSTGNYNVNFLFQILGNPSVCYASEHSQVDPGMRQMILKTTNLSFCRYIAVDETVSYAPHPQDSEKTLLKQEAVVTVQGIPLHNYVEDLLTNKISLNAGKGRQAIEWVISKFNTEVKDLTSSAVKSTDEIIAQTKKSLDDITETARKSMDDLSTAAKKSFDDIQNLKYVPPRTNQSLPEL
ncbi:uncharacterized protein GBIM_02864 [Gryllus bimaculatus]|nr:uncharacterized protein GBIM_02864 [Gryllus bimaculatus]